MSFYEPSSAGYSYDADDEDDGTAGATIALIHPNGEVTHAPRHVEHDDLAYRAGYHGIHHAIQKGCVRAYHYPMKDEIGIELKPNPTNIRHAVDYIRSHHEGSGSIFVDAHNNKGVRHGVVDGSVIDTSSRWLGPKTTVHTSWKSAAKRLQGHTENVVPHHQLHGWHRGNLLNRIGLAERVTINTKFGDLLRSVLEYA